MLYNTSFALNIIHLLNNHHLTLHWPTTSCISVLKIKMPSVKNTITFLLGQALLATGSPVDVEKVEKRQCPKIHVFGARETTAPPGYGSSGTVVNLVISAHPGTTSEAINYPACGGQSSCGGVSYANSAFQGINAVVTAVNNFHNSCPNTQLVLVGYSQVCASHPVNASNTNKRFKRVAKSLMTHFAAEVILLRDTAILLFLYLQEQSLLSRPQSLWETLETFTDCLTMSEPVLPKV